MGLPSAKRLRTEYERTHEIFLQPQKKTKSIFADKHEKREYANFGTKKPVYDEILNCVRNNQPEVIFCDAPAGTGETLTEKCFAARLRAPVTP